MLLYATCTLNRDYLSPYAPLTAGTPNLARFAENAAVFQRHMTESGQSGIAFASILTGTQVDRHGVFLQPSPLNATTATDLFADAGWEVGAWLEHDMASGELGYGPPDSKKHKLQAGDPDFAALLESLRSDPQHRAFVVTNFTVTHGPYQLATLELYCGRWPDACGAYNRDPEAFQRYADFYRRSHGYLSYDFDATRERAGMSDEHLANMVEVIDLLYRANVAYLDSLFGALMAEIEAAGLADETLVAFTADHGETLFREGTYFKWTHGHQLAPEVLTVPLLIGGPGIQAGPYEAVTRSIDVLPTLAELAGLPAPASSTGISLAPALRGRAAPPDLTAWSHTAMIAIPLVEVSQKWGLFNRLYPGLDPELMWAQRRDGDRLVQLRRNLDGELEPAVFDLAQDPGTLHNLFQPNDPEMRRALQEVRDYRQRLIDAYKERAVDGLGLDTERQRELLDGLGYLGN